MVINMKKREAINMPCSKYKGKQKALCFATKEWTDWSKIKKDNKVKTKVIKIKVNKVKGG